MARLALTCAAAALLLGGAGADAALGAAVSVQSGVLVYSAGAGETNNVTVAPSGADLDVSDTGAALTPGAGCSPSGPNAVSCTDAATTIAVSLADGTDKADLSAVNDRNSTLHGGEGDDVLIGGGANDQLLGDGGRDTADYSHATTGITVTVNQVDADGPGGEFDNVECENVRGGSGNDRLSGDAGANVLEGGPGQDELDGRGGPDDLSGGADADVADYGNRIAPVTADLEGDADDGEAGEGDVIRTDVETIRGGGGNDVLTGGAGADVLQGMNGNDTLDGADGDDTLQGEFGDDVLRGGNGIDALLANEGDDTLDGGTGPDLLTGGLGTDTVDYSSRTRNLTVDLFMSGLDGEVGEEDAVRDIEAVRGGAGNDKLTASTGPVSFVGNAGDDTVQGNIGDDVLTGDAGKDKVAGAGGSDSLNGGTGQDELDGGNGDDVINARDGEKDTVTCGAGADTLIGDTLDVVESDCEKVDRKVGPAVTLPSGTLRVEKKRYVRVRVGCPGRTIGNCKGTITIQGRKPKRRLGRASFDIAPGKVKRVLVRLSSSAAALLAKQGSVAATLVVTARDGVGNRSTRRRSIRLR